MVFIPSHGLGLSSIDSYVLVVLPSTTYFFSGALLLAFLLDKLINLVK